MSDTRRSKPQLEIPDGLEVVRPEGPEHLDYGGLEAVNPYVFEKDTKSDHLQVTVASAEHGIPAAHLPWMQRLGRRKLIIAGVIGFVLIIAVVLGAVLGSRLHNKPASSATSTSSSGTQSTPTSTAAGTTATASSSTFLKENSAISVTGWTSTSGYSIRVFYQGGDGIVRLSSYESSTGNWDSPLVLDIAAKSGTPLGSSSIAEPFYFGFTDDKSGFQVELFYLTEQNILQEWTLKDTLMGNGSSSELGITLPADSKIVSYWPSVLYQSKSGDIQEMVLSGSWNIQSTSHTALSGGAFVEIPFQSNYPDGGNHLFYQQDDGKVVEVVGNSSAGWSNSQPVFSMPKGSSLGAFAVLNKRVAPSVDTYVLYQDVHGKIQVMWQDDETGWKGPTAPSAFQSADNGTSIACLTPMAWPGTTLRQENLQTCRCYYQSSGSLKEVWFNGTGWQLLGEVPTT